MLKKSAMRGIEEGWDGSEKEEINVVQDDCTNLIVSTTSLSIIIIDMCAVCVFNVQKNEEVIKRRR